MEATTETKEKTTVYIAGYYDCHELVSFEAFSSDELRSEFMAENNNSRKNKQRGYGWESLAECVVDEA